MRILLVEDEQDLGLAIKQVLVSEKYVVDWVTDGAEAWDYLESQWTDYTLAIFDWLLPNLSGLDLCLRLRAKQNPLPVLMLTALGQPENRITGLDAGADDYLIKPFVMEELLARLRALQRRSPLASLLATVEAILRVPQANPEDTQTMLHKVEKQGRRLSNLIAELLLLSSLEQNSYPKKFQSCCLNDLVNDLTEEMSELATASNIHLTSQVPSMEIYVLGNESQLYRLVSNLITNAIQYTSAQGDVHISLEVQDHNAVIAVKDTGMGIPKSEQNRIFDRFYRVDGDRSSKKGGTGLGLAIVQAIVHRHQGYLTVKSELGIGSIFTIHLSRMHYRGFQINGDRIK